MIKAIPKVVDLMQYKRNKIVAEDLKNLQKLIKGFDKLLFKYKHYVPVQAIKETLRFQNELIGYHLKNLKD
jgi:trimethylamine:corrinoid methyltransferase-like protein